MTADDQLREDIKTALSNAGAYCGACGFQPGDRGCPDCERCWDSYTDGLMPIIRAETLMAEVLPTRAETAIEYGIRVPGAVYPKDGVLLAGDTFDRAEQETRLEDSRRNLAALYPGQGAPELVSRTIARSPWEPVTAPGTTENSTAERP